MLTARQQEVLNWIWMGKSNCEIGLILGITTLTTKNHVQKLFKRLGINGRISAIREAIKQGIITPELPKLQALPEPEVVVLQKQPEVVVAQNEHIKVYGDGHVEYDGERVKLTPIDVKMLKFFILNAGRVHTRNQVIDDVWGSVVAIEDRSVDSHVHRLRGFLKNTPWHIFTVRGFGYRYDAR